MPKLKLFVQWGFGKVYSFLLIKQTNKTCLLLINLFKSSREALEEDEDGLIESSIADIIEKSKRKRHADKIGVRLGMMRHMNVILDCSDAMLDQDLKPTRHLCTLKVRHSFNCNNSKTNKVV